MKNNLRVERAILNISQQELADRVGVTRATINAIENGKYAPSGLVLLKIASICGKSAEDIFQLEEKDWE
ncbi:MAG: helix-turn-helix transcriptional regulator [Bacteroidales bacterium]|nr:helix-turn-helix transcriptional regulator [Bacteroidales bacterium]